MDKLPRSIATTFVTFAAADVLAQRINPTAAAGQGAGKQEARQSVRDDTNEPDLFSPSRTARYAAIGGFVMAPLFHGWYSFIEPRMPGRVFWYKKLLLECFSIAPLYLVLNMAAATAMRERGWFRGLDEAWGGGSGAKQVDRETEPGSGADGAPGVGHVVQEKLKADWAPLYVDALKVVPFYQAANFLLVPERFRMLWLNGCQLVWNVWVALCIAKEPARVAEDDGG